MQETPGFRRYAGVTRRRVNALIAEQLRAGRKVRHWVLPLLDDPQGRLQLRAVLETREKSFIRLWELRRLGWNRI